MRTPTLTKPVFGVDFFCAACAYELRLNDVPLFRHEENPIRARLPANAYLLEKNLLELRLRPLEGAEHLPPEPTQRAALVVKQEDGEQDHELCAIEWKGPLPPEEVSQLPDQIERKLTPEPGSPLEGLGEITLGKLVVASGPAPGEVRLTREVTLGKPPFPAWSWTAGKKIEPNEETKAQLTDQVRKIWDLLSRREEAAILSRMRVVQSEMATAFYMTPEQSQAVLAPIRMLRDPDVALEPLMEDAFELEVFGQGRLARLTLFGDGPIVFMDKGQELVHFVHLTFSLTDDGWVIVR